MITGLQLEWFAIFKILQAAEPLLAWLKVKPL
jgi:hypothetical protein